MSAVFKTEAQAVLPLNISREELLEHIQKYDTIIRANPNVDHFDRVHSKLEDHILSDSFFAQDTGGSDITTYKIHERLPIVPFLGISKAIEFSVYYQNFTNGVRAKVDAPGGTTARVTYTVRPLERSGAELRRGAWRLVEESKVECGVLVKPFVFRTFQNAHAKICQRIVDDLSNQSRAGDVSQSIPPGDGTL